MVKSRLNKNRALYIGLSAFVAVFIIVILIVIYKPSETLAGEAARFAPPKKDITATTAVSEFITTDVDCEIRRGQTEKYCYASCPFDKELIF